MITVKTYGGLANRMRVIDSAYQICLKTGHDLGILWEMSWELNCSFHKLFEPVDIFSVSEFYKSKYGKKAESFIHKSFRIFGLNLPFGYDTYIFNRSIESSIRNNSATGLFPEGANIYLSTVHQFMKGEKSFSYFKPIKELQLKIDENTGKYSDKTVGIHIRRTDNVKSILSSPREAFIEKMKSEIAQDKNTMFFLATDSVDEEKQLRAVFPDRIITHEKELSRNSSRGIQDALVDIYCLSCTKKIIGSFYSSFSEVAAQIGEIPLELINIKS